MDPNYFYLDWERLGEVLMTVVVFAFVLERALAPLFESRFFLDRFQGRSLKELIAVTLGFIVCWVWKFDVLSIIVTQESTTVFGYLITGATIAGGSKASIKLFHDLMKVRSTRQELEEVEEARVKARRAAGAPGGSADQPIN